MTIDIKQFLAENPNVKKVVLNQFFGLGDILFIEPIYRYLHDLGLEVIAPIQDGYIWIQEHINYVSFKKMSEYNINYERFEHGLLILDGNIIEDTLYLPTRFSDQVFRDLKPHDASASRYWMSDKYRVLGLPVEQWETIKFTRNYEREEKLKQFVLNGVTEYDFYNPFFQNSLNINLGLDEIVKGDLPLIKMDKIDGYTMIDWCSIIEGARKVSTVSTSLLYMIQSIYQPGKEYHLYPRLPERSFYTVDDFLPSYWIKHEM